MSGPYDVVWENDALDALLVLMTSTGTAAGMTRDVEEIHSELAHVPASKGRPLSEGLRCFNATYLAAYYSIDDDELIVHVQQVGLLG